MAAPNIAGPCQPGGYQYDENDPGSELTDEVRPASRVQAERIAELAARLAAIESRDRGNGPDRTGRTGATTASSGQSAQSQSGSHPPTATGADVAPLPSLAGPGGPGGPPHRGAWATVAIGSSGSTGVTDRRRATPGGHPEDAPGDPEAVAKAICLRLLTGAARPRAALATALRERGIPDEVATAVLDRFVEVGLIDDQAYAAAFVAAKHRDRALGVTALRTELRRKGVDEVTVDAAVQAVDSEAECNRARALISRRVDAAMGNGVPAARRRLVGLLARRGYSAELARQVVEEALADYGAADDTGWSD